MKKLWLTQQCWNKSISLTERAFTDIWKDLFGFNK